MFPRTTELLLEYLDHKSLNTATMCSAYLNVTKKFIVFSLRTQLLKISILAACEQFTQPGSFYPKTLKAKEQLLQWQTHWGVKIILSISCFNCMRLRNIFDTSITSLLISPFNQSLRRNVINHNLLSRAANDWGQWLSSGFYNVVSLNCLYGEKEWSTWTVNLNAWGVTF